MLEFALEFDSKIYTVAFKTNELDPSIPKYLLGGLALACGTMIALKVINLWSPPPHAE